MRDARRRRKAAGSRAFRLGNSSAPGRRVLSTARTDVTPPPGQTQVIVALTQTVLPACVFAVVLVSTGQIGHGLTLQNLFLLGTLTSAWGAASALWTRVWPTLLLSVVLAVLGLVSLALMTVLPHPSADPALLTTGEWTRGVMPLASGWDRYVMSLLLILAGVTLPLALKSQSRQMALLGLVVARICLWYGALWQLGFLSLDGGLAKFLAADTSGLQFAILAAATIGAVLLLRGDRRWLGALTAFDRSVTLARFLMPLMLMPIIAAGLLVLAAREGAVSRGVALVLNAELDSIALLFVGLASLRGLWLERRRRSALSRAVESSPVMIHSAQSLIEYWPRGCERLFGYTAEEAVGRRATELLRTEYPVPLPEIIEAIRRTGEWVGEVRQTARDGRRLWIATRVARDRPEPGAELKLVETMTDISELKRSANALRDTTDSLQQVVAGYGVGMIDYRPRDGGAQFSPQMEQMLGLRPGDLGSDYSVWFKLVHPDDIPRVTAMFLEGARRNAPGGTVIFKVMHSDGAYRDLQAVLRYDYDLNGRLSRIAGVYMDVTEVVRDRMEVAERGARLLELQKELTHTSRLSGMGELAAGLAHELNQPLAAVGNSVGAIGLMLRDDDTPIDSTLRQRLRRAAHHAESQTVRAGEIVRRLREFIARSEADSKVEDLGRLVDDSLGLALPNPAASNVEISKFIPPEAAAVLADRIQIQQVLVNLIRNAVEAMVGCERPSLLRIGVEAREGMALVRVIDNGSGVADDGMSTLFSPFVSTKREGMGVGLFVSRRIIESHGGKLWFEPVEDGGAEFCFTLPLATADTWDDSARRDSPPAPE
jgi:two-component system sensor kinase FixL